MAGSTVSGPGPDEVKHFLLTLKFAVANCRWSLVDRDKNLNDIACLGMTLAEVSEVLQSLTVNDYCEGPMADDKGRQKQWWVFGPVYAGIALYVKVCVNRHGWVECLSFHRAEYPMNYPFREGRTDK